MKWLNLYFHVTESYCKWENNWEMIFRLNPIWQQGPSPSVRREPRVLTDAVLRNQEDTAKAVHEIKDQLPNINKALMEINESLKPIAAFAIQMINKP